MLKPCPINPEYSGRLPVVTNPLDCAPHEGVVVEAVEMGVANLLPQVWSGLREMDDEFLAGTEMLIGLQHLLEKIVELSGLFEGSLLFVIHVQTPVLSIHGVGSTLLLGSCTITKPG